MSKSVTALELVLNFYWKEQLGMLKEFMLQEYSENLFS